MTSALGSSPSGHEHVAADLIRVFFGLVPAGILVGLVLAVVFSYYRAWRITRYRSVKAGLLPKHVWTIGVSYLIILADSLYSLTERLHRPLNPHTFVVAPGYVLGIYSLIMVLRFERLRYATESGVTRDLGPRDGV